jgi:cytochrome P450
MRSWAAPPATLFGGHVRHFTGDLLGFLSRCERDFGAIVPLRIYNVPVFLINDPDVVAEVLVRRHASFEKGLAIQILRPMFGDGLLSAPHAHWRKHRTLLQPAFRRRAIERYTTSMIESTRALLDSWVPGSRRDIHDDMMSLTLDIVVRSLFGSDVSHRDRAAVIAAAHALQEFFGRFRRSYVALPAVIPTPANLILRRSARRLDASIYAMIEARRRSGARGDDILSLLLDARDEHGAAISERQIRDELATLFLAGTETTAGALAWSFYLLARNPQVRDALSDEVDRVLQGAPPTADDLPRLVYTDKLFKEVLRLYPTAHVFGRTAIEPCELRGHRITPGAQILISPWAIQRSRRHYDEPDQFRPERWTPEMTAKLHKLAYLPFGGGARSCIGGVFATTEAKLILATIAQRFSIELPAGVEVRPDPAVTLRSAGGLPMIVRARSNSQRLGKNAAESSRSHG